MPKHLIRLNRTLLALLLMLPLTALAQHSQPYLSESWSMVPKADRTEAFWEGLKEHMAVREKHAPRKPLAGRWGCSGSTTAGWRAM